MPLIGEYGFGKEESGLGRHGKGKAICQKAKIGGIHSDDANAGNLVRQSYFEKKKKQRKAKGTSHWPFLSVYIGTTGKVGVLRTKEPDTGSICAVITGASLGAGCLPGLLS